MKEKIQKVLEKAFPNSKISIIKYWNPKEDYKTHNVFIIKYGDSGKEKKIVLKFLSNKIRKIIPSLRYNLLNEALTIETINKLNNFSIPLLIYFDEKKEAVNSPVMLSEYIEGTRLSELPSQERGKYLERMLIAIKKIHSLDVKKFGFLKNQNFGKYIIKELKRLIRVNKATAEKEQIKFAEEVLKKLEKDVPSKTDRSLLHGDLEPGHFILGENREFHIIDWDASIIGDRSWDIFWMMKGAPEELYGTKKEIIIDSYEKISKHKLINKDFYETCSLLMSYLYFMFIIKNEPDHPHYKIVHQALLNLEKQLRDKIK